MPNKNLLDKGIVELSFIEVCDREIQKYNQKIEEADIQEIKTYYKGLLEEAVFLRAVAQLKGVK